MITLAPRASADVVTLETFYRERDREAAIRNLKRQLASAIEKLAQGNARSRPAPASFPELAAEGRAWLKAGPYWIVHSLTDPPTILRIFHEASDFAHHDQRLTV